MALPINIDSLINGRTVEWERIEFKAGWNPEDVLHTLCAFANDINNWGGGYIVLGIAEKDGRPVLPPKGLHANQIDAIQKKLLEVCHLIVPTYFPIVQPVIFRKKHILVLWAPGGDARPYKAPTTIGGKGVFAYYVRRFSNTVKAKPSEEKLLYALAAKIPFDDRINHHAELTELKLPLIQSFLREIGSELLDESGLVPLAQLSRQMSIARGSDEYLKPINVGLLFFNDTPNQFFKGAKIEIVEYHDEIGDTFSEKVFLGPIHQQLKDALEYIQKFIIKEDVRKIPRKAKAERFFNFPYEAVREALANAVYHRSYEHQSSIEVNVRFDSIEILSFPGPLPPVDNALLRKPRVVARDYRNRRVGDFLKELHLTEGRGTGIPKIRRAMKNNGSPQPKFTTDADRTYFIATIPVHHKATTRPKTQVEAQVEILSEEKLSILRFCLVPKSKKEILGYIGVTSQTKNFKLHIEPFIKEEYLRLLLPDKPKSKKQKYVTSPRGIELLNKPEQP